MRNALEMPRPLSPDDSSSVEASSQLTRWTLEFSDAELERRYRHALRRDTEAIVRRGLLLAALLFALFGVHDTLLDADHLVVALGLRAFIVSVILLLFAFSFTSAFERYREPLLFAFGVFMSVGLAAIVLACGEVAADRYYAGYIMIGIASYLLIGVSFTTGTLAAVVAFGVYLATEVMFFGGFDLDALMDSSFLLGSIAIASVGTYAFGRQRRLAYWHGLSLEREHSESRHSALHDALTGLPNRRLLMEKLAQAVARDERFKSFAAVLFIDLDAFKPVNDRYGHEVGDRLLQAVAARLQEAVRATDTVARLGGDEFVVLLEDLADPAAVAPFIDRLLDRFVEPCALGDVAITARLSIGHAVHPTDGATPGELLDAADQAMYRVKRRHGRR